MRHRYHDADDRESLTDVTGESATKRQVQATIMRIHARALIPDLVPLLLRVAHDPLDRLRQRPPTKSN